MKTYRFPTNITDRKTAELVLQGIRKAALFGRYPFGEGYLEQLLSMGIQIDACFDSSADDEDKVKELLGIRVYDKKMLSGYKGVVILCGNGHYHELESYARKKGVIEMLPYYFVFDGKEYTESEYQNIYQVANVAKTHYVSKMQPDVEIINSLEIAITHRCTLNCEKCANLMSYFAKPTDADFEKMKASIGKILDSQVYVSELRVLGGEPFLAQHFDQYIELLLSYDNIGLISIMTNGTILPTEQTLSLCRNPRVHITVSDYNDLSRKKDELLRELVKHHILHRVYEIDGWRDCNKIEYKEMDDVLLEKKYLACSVNNCWTLYNDYLFLCPYNAGVTVLHAVPEEMTDAIIIRDIPQSEIISVVKQFKNTRKSNICKYCNGRPKSVVDIEVAKQIKHKHSFHQYEYKKEQYI